MSFNLKYPTQKQDNLNDSDAYERLPAKSPCSGLGYKTKPGVQVSFTYDFFINVVETYPIFGVPFTIFFLSPASISIEVSAEKGLSLKSSSFQGNLKFAFILNRPYFSLAGVNFPLPAIIVVAVENGFFEIETYLYTIEIQSGTAIVFIDIWLVICANPKPPLGLINAYFVVTIEVPELDARILNVAFAIPLTYPSPNMTLYKTESKKLLKESVIGSISQLAFASTLQYKDFIKGAIEYITMNQIEFIEDIKDIIEDYGDDSTEEDPIVEEEEVEEEEVEVEEEEVEVEEEEVEVEEEEVEVEEEEVEVEEEEVEVEEEEVEVEEEEVEVEEEEVEVEEEEVEVEEEEEEGDNTRILYVSEGSFSSPYYLFYDNSDGTVPIEDLVLHSNQTYVFARLNNSTSHPFYISDKGRKQQSENITITGDGSYVQGIYGSQSFTLSFNSSFDSNSILYYYCTSHSSMVSEISVNIV